MADISKIKLPSNTEYDIKDATARANKLESTSVAGVELTTTATKNYAVGDYLILSGGTLYKVTSPISTGGTITVGTNVTTA